MGYLTVYERSIRARNGMYRGSSSIHPSFHPTVGRVVERVCAEARERTARWSVRASASMDRSGIFSMHRVSSSSFACVGRIGRVGRPEDGWMVGLEKPRRGATLRARKESILSFFWRVVNRGFVRGSNTTLRVLSGSGSGERSVWMERWMGRWMDETGVNFNFVRLTIWV